MTPLALVATGYGLLGAASSLLEAARLLKAGNSDEISLSFLGVLLGGYLVWLVYGISERDAPLMITDSVGLAASTITLSIAVRLRLLHGARGPWHLAAPTAERAGRQAAAAGTRGARGGR